MILHVEVVVYGKESHQGNVHEVVDIFDEPLDLSGVILLSPLTQLFHGDAGVLHH